MPRYPALAVAAQGRIDQVKASLGNVTEKGPQSIEVDGEFRI